MERSMDFDSTLIVLIPRLLSHFFISIVSEYISFHRATGSLSLRKQAFMIWPAYSFMEMPARRAGSGVGKAQRIQLNSPCSSRRSMIRRSFRRATMASFMRFGSTFLRCVRDSGAARKILPFRFSRSRSSHSPMNFLWRESVKVKKSFSIAGFASPRTTTFHFLCRSFR